MGYIGLAPCQGRVLSGQKTNRGSGIGTGELGVFDCGDGVMPPCVATCGPYVCRLLLL